MRAKALAAASLIALALPAAAIFHFWVVPSLLTDLEELEEPSA